MRACRTAPHNVCLEAAGRVPGVGARARTWSASPLPTRPPPRWWQPFGVRVYDVSDPRQPTALGAFQTRGFPDHLIVTGNRAYVAMQQFASGMAASGQGIQVLDVSDPRSLAEVSFIPDGALGLASDGPMCSPVMPGPCMSLP
jgi:hypothetical protein